VKLSRKLVGRPATSFSFNAGRLSAFNRDYPATCFRLPLPLQLQVLTGKESLNCKMVPGTCCVTKPILVAGTRRNGAKPYKDFLFLAEYSPNLGARVRSKQKELAVRSAPWLVCKGMQGGLILSYSIAVLQTTVRK
jgi:hypothetical protein